jgi:hypothetical protein
VKKILLFLITVHFCLFSQDDCCDEVTEINFSLESKFGEGTSIKNQGSTEEPYNYFENILDVNIQFSSNVSLWSQLEYSDPPIFGTPKDGLNKFYFEYSNNNFNVKAGNLYSLYGSGLALNMVLNQNVDLDNSVKGIDFELYPSDNIKLFSLIGKGNYNFRTNPAQITTDRSIYNRVYSGGIEYEFENFGILQTFFVNQTSIIDEDMMTLYNNEHLDTRLGKEFYDRVQYEDFRDDTLSSIITNFNWSNAVGPVDFYLEYSGNKYSKLLGDEVNGYKIYGTLSTYLAGFGITYEYKDYNEPYFIQSLSGAPIVYRESTSILGSRYSHSINFGDEIGHQLEVQYSINENLNWMINLSQANSHIGTYKHITIDSVGIEVEDLASYNHSNPFSLIFMNGNDEDLAFKPFRQFYTEFSGYSFNGHLFYQIGIDQLDDIYKYHFTKEFDYDQIEINDFIQTFEIDLNNYLDSELILIDEQYQYQEDLTNSTYQTFYDICDLWGFCNGLTPEQYADSTFLNDYSITYNDSLIILENIYNENKLELEADSLNMRIDGLKSKKYEYEKQTVITIPLRFAWNFGNGSSITTYWEHQWRNVVMNHDYLLLDGTLDSRTTNIEKYYNQYLTLSYRSPSKWSVTLFYDGETHNKKLGGEVWSEGYNDWTGIDFSFDLNSSSQMSVFYGSQKGGRICANGICADQPGFKDGFKLTYRSFF